MWERDCGIVPVVDAEGRVVGVVTDRDLCMASYTQGRALTAVPVSWVLCGRAVHTCTPSDSIDRAIALMREHRVRRLVVVDGQQKLIGVLSLADIARHVAELTPGQPKAPLVLAGLLAALSERRGGGGSAQRAANGTAQ
jgi:CBS-domain-containing membrane protein